MQPAVGAATIARIESEHDVGAVHRTRIAAKNLRYLVETLEPRAAATEVAADLSSLQDELGVVHDMQLLLDGAPARRDRDRGRRSKHEASSSCVQARSSRKIDTASPSSCGSDRSRDDGELAAHAPGIGPTNRSRTSAERVGRARRRTHRCSGGEPRERNFEGGPNDFKKG